MGPRLISRGTANINCGSTGLMGCFNGAAADQPRNEILERGKPLRDQSFNGAAADQPRNASA